jgi:hypothetical protein
MKPFKQMKYLRFATIVFCSLLFFNVSLISQDEPTKKVRKPVRYMFESTLLIDHQTVIVPIKGTFQFDILHRFGTSDGYDDFFGLFDDSNFRLGFNYVPMNRLQIGFGFSKENLLWDFNAKYALIRQSRDGVIPLSVSYFTNVAIDTRDGDNFLNSSDRFSYFHQVLLARKFSDAFSVQIAGSFSHFNAVTAELNLEGTEVVGAHGHDHLAISLMGRYKIGEAMGIIVATDFPLTSHDVQDPEANISFGLEFSTSSHAFQLFVGNYKGIIPQYNQQFNQNSFGDSEILIGFNMTRLWNF